MGVPKKLLLEAAEIVGLGDEVALFEALAALASKWKDMAVHLDGFTTAEALLLAIADGTTNESVVEAFQKAGADDALATLQSGAAKLKVLFDKVPESAKILLNPIGNFNEFSGGAADRGLINWPLQKSLAAGGANAGDATKSDYALSLDANAALTIEAGDKWPYGEQIQVPLLRMRAGGGLKAKGSATVPFGGGGLSASGNVGADCALEYYFNVADQSSIYALAVAERIGNLVDPFDFDSVWDGFAGSDLAGIHYSFEGSAAANVSVSLADTAALGAGVKIDLGATISVGFTLAGHYFLSFRTGGTAADGTPRIIAALSRKRSKGIDGSIKLGATIDLSALATRVRAILGTALDKWDKVLKELTPYLSPGTWLQENGSSLIANEAAKLIKNPALKDAVVRDLQSVIGVGTQSDSDLAEWLERQLTGALDAAEKWTDGKADAAVSLLDNLGRNLPAFAQDEIRATLQGTADMLVKAASDELRAKVTALVASDKNALGKALNDILKKSGDAARDIVADADSAFASVRELIERYDALFRKVVAATEDATKAKISVAIALEEGRLSSTTLEIEGTFLSRSDRARDIFRSLTRGDLGSLIKLIDEGTGGADFALNAERSSLKRFASGKSKIGVELVAFGFGMSGSDLLSSEASVLVDGTGNVQVDAKFKLEKRFKGVDADREIDLIGSFSLVMARALANAPASEKRGVGLAVSMGHVDDALKRQEALDFVESLTKAALLAPDILSKAMDGFSLLAGNDGANGKFAGALQLKLILGTDGIAKLLRLGDAGTAGPLGEQQRLAILLAAFEALREHDKRNADAIDATQAFVAQKPRPLSLADCLVNPRTAEKKLETKISGKFGEHVQSFDKPFVNALALSNGMLTMIEKMREIYFSTPEQREDDDDFTWSPNDYRDAEHKAASAVRPWLQLNNQLFWAASEVHPRTMAFLDAVSNLAGVVPQQALTLIMWRNGDDGKPHTIVLTPTAP